MATEVGDTWAPSDTSGSGVFGADSASVDGDNASKSAVNDAEEEILRLRVRGFRLGREKYTTWQKVVILRAGHRKVAIRLLSDKHSLLGRDKEHSLLINLDHVILDLSYISSVEQPPRCTLREQKTSDPHRLEFGALQDVFRFQEIFTGFGVQIHMYQKKLSGCFTAIQIWRQIPDRYESLIHAHDGLRDLPGYENNPAQINTTTASDKGLRSVDSSVMNSPPSSLLVFSGPDIGASVDTPLMKIPLDGNISIAMKDISRDVRLVVDGDKTTHQQKLLLGGAFALAPALAFATLNPLLPAGMWSAYRLPKLSKFNNSIDHKLVWVELRFANKEDERRFKAAYEAETHSPKRKAFAEPVSLTRKYDGDKWDISDEDDVIPPAKQTSANPALTPLQGAKAGQVDSSAPRSQPQRSLAGDSTIHPDRMADIIPSLTASLDSKFRPQQGLAGNSTIHSNGRADIVPLAAGSSDFDSKFHGRSRSSDVLDADQQTSSKTSYESTVGEMKRLRSRIMEDTGGEGRTPRLQVPLPTKGKTRTHPLHVPLPTRGVTRKPFLRVPRKEGLHIVPNITKRVSFVEATCTPKLGTTDSASTDNGTKGSNKVLRLLDEPQHSETSAKQMQWRSRICRKIVLIMLWKREQNDGVPKEMWSSPASFEFIHGLEISRFDKIKSLFETYSGREWEWWPFKPPAKPLEKGKVRIRWQCTCGDQRWTDASTYLALQCQAFVNENTAAGHESGNAASQSAGSTASHPHPRSVIPGSFPSDTSQSTGVTSNIHSTAQAGHIQETNKSSHSKDLYVLLCIYQGSQIHHSQILASKCQNDEAFFENLRQDYRRLRGFFRFWLSPLQFSHCDFVKFTRFYVNELAKVGHSLPIDLVYQYNPRPPGPHEDPPISPHEFRRRFYTDFANPCGRDEALERIPKRQKRFQINLHVDGREDMWGLHVELRPSFLVVLMWQIVITAGGWAFMGWWLSRHQGDLQNAAVPVTLIVTAIMALWAPIRKGMTEAL